MILHLIQTERYVLFEVLVSIPFRYGTTCIEKLAGRADIVAVRCQFLLGTVQRQRKVELLRMADELVSIPFRYGTTI